MDVIELRRQRAELVGQLNEIHSDHAGADLPDEIQTRWDELRAGIDSLDAQIARAEEMALLNGGHDERQRQSERRQQPDLGLTPGEVQRYSFLRAIRAAHTGDWSGAGFERECHEATEERIGEPAQGFYVPADVATMDTQNEDSGSIQIRTPDGYQYVSQERAVSPAGSGANLIATNLAGDQFIDLLRNRMVVQMAGARVLRDLVGNLDIPRQTGAATFAWKADDAETALSDSTFDQVQLRPKTGSAATELTRNQIMQASVDMEQLTRSDLAQVVAVGFDAASFYGAGSDEPQGIKGATGVGAPAGTLPNWATVVEFEEVVAAANAEMGRLAYVSSAKMRGTLKITPKVAGTASMVWAGGGAPLNERPAFVTEQIDDADGGADLTSLFYGNWGDLLIGVWGALDLLVDPYSNSRRGRVRLVAHMSGDIGLRHPQSFAYKAIDMS